MRIFWGIVLVFAVSYCRAEDYSDLAEYLVYASNCETINGKEGACVKQSQCRPQKLSPRSFDFGAPEIPKNPCGRMKICCPIDNVILDHKEAAEVHLGCGYSNPGGVRMRTLTGKATYAAYADFPWMVAVMVKKDNPDKTFADEYIGGGTLIHPSVVMTVAHKVYQAEPNELKCRAGEWDWSIDSEQNKHQERDVTDIVINENFSKVNIYYDVALLILSSPYDLENSPHIGVACLEPNLPEPDTICYSMGWGKDIISNNKNAKILKKLQLPLVQKEKCENSLRNTRLGKRYKLHKSFTCAGGEAGVDTCEGDGGSSLVCRITDPNRLRYSVVGMVTYGVDCGLENIPGVYAKVPEFYDWVIEKMSTLSYNITYFMY